jgi:hypothetical protein
MIIIVMMMMMIMIIIVMMIIIFIVMMIMLVVLILILIVIVIIDIHKSIYLSIIIHVGGYSSNFLGGGACLSHDHATQYRFVLQSFTLWKEIMANMPKLWLLADLDMIKEGYRLVSAYVLING